MIQYTSENQLPLSGFETPFETTLDNNNRWVKLASHIPWDELATAYYSSFHHSHGRLSCLSPVFVNRGKYSLIEAGVIDVDFRALTID